MSAEERIFIGLGSNLGDRRAALDSAIRDFEQSPDIEVIRRSSFYETVPEGGPPDQPNYLNAVAELRTALGPRELLTRLLEIEARHGRQRSVPAGPRTLDLDLLLYGMRVVVTHDLVIPHPRMWQREFVMRPLAEICASDYLDRVIRRFTKDPIL